MNPHPQPLIDQVQVLAGESVERTFKEMLGIHLHPGDPGTTSSDPEGQIVGSVGFVGEANGVVHLYASEHFARVITGRMLGLPEGEIDRDDIVNDAMGELSNVIVGRVKSRLCDGGLTAPAPSPCRPSCGVDTGWTTTRRTPVTG